MKYKILDTIKVLIEVVGIAMLLLIIVRTFI